MDSLIPNLNQDEKERAARTGAIFQDLLVATRKRTDSMLAWLLMLQWLAGIVAALYLSPKTWEGRYNETHIHVWAAIFLGGLISGLPIVLARKDPGATLTRHAMAVGQMLTCGLLIHLTGGWIETHFQYFVTLAFLAFYRDWRVLLTASVVAAADHLIRGYFWPESIYGVPFASEWRSFEHIAWIVFEDIVLVLMIRQNLFELLGVAERQAKLESVNEIIERTVAERTSELRKEIAGRERLVAIMESTTDWVSMSDANGGLLYMNLAGRNRLGFGPDEDITRSRISDFHPEHTKSLILNEALPTAIRQGTWSGETVFLSCRGEEIPVSQVILSHKAPDGTIEFFSTIIRDITEQKKTETSLRLLNSAVEQSKESIVITDAELDLPGPRIVFVNPAFTKMTGYTSEEVMGKTPRLLQGPRTDLALMHRLRKNLERGEVFAGETVNYRKDGNEYDLEWQVAPLRNRGGEITNFVAIQRDVTERKQREARQFQSQKMETVGKLAGGVAHEFNSILTAIIGQSELLLEDLPINSPLVQNATEIRLAAERAATLTRQLLAFGRKQILRPVILDLNSVLSEMIGTLQHLVGRDVNVSFVPASGLKAVKMDPGQVEQVIVNIAMNSAHAMPNGGKLILETSNVTLDEEFVRAFPELEPGGYVMLAITDTGSGMSDEVKARAFEPFFSTKGVGEGTGLGLATCHGILKQSNGHISVYSEVARGTTFKIYLPQVDQQKIVAGPEVLSADLPPRTETILFAEDDPSLLRMSATFLRRLGYTVLTAANGLEALTLKNKKNVGHIDLLVTDVVMPHMSGTELADRIRSAFPETKILFTSAYTENAIIHQGIRREGITLLQKPFSPSALASKVREVLDQTPTEQS